MPKERSAWDNLGHQAHTITAKYHPSRLQPSCWQPPVGVTCRQCNGVSPSPRFCCSLLFWLLAQVPFWSTPAPLCLPWPWKSKQPRDLGYNFPSCGNAVPFTKAVWAGKAMLRTQRISVCPIHCFSPVCLRWALKYTSLTNLQQLPQASEKAAEAILKLVKECKTTPKYLKKKGNQISAVLLFSYTLLYNFFYSLIMFVDKGI